MALLAVADAQQRIIALTPRLASESVHLRDARHRINAADIIATRALPSFDNSAMDGYAVRASDVPATLPVTAVIAAGAAVTQLPTLAPGTAMQIFTGAPLPPGADAVIIVEDVTRQGDTVVLPAVRSGDNVRRCGEDIAGGECAITAGIKLGAGALAMLAAQGCSTVQVARRPRVAIIATGDELVDVDTPLQPGQIVDSSAHMLAAQIREAGGEPHYLGVIADEPTAMTRALQQALSFDVVLTTGGVSAGERDYVRPALAAAGIELEFWKVAMKRGKPFAFGLGTSTLVFALPGNPVSSLVAFELFVRPALLAMQGAATLFRLKVPVRLPTGFEKSAGRAHFLRAHVGGDDRGLVAEVHHKQGSAMLSSIVNWNALVEIPADATTIVADGIAMAWLTGE